MNQLRGPDQLSSALLSSTKLKDPADLIALFHSPKHGRNYWAKQAHCVIDCAAAGDPVSVAMLRQAGQDLAQLARRTAQQLGITGPIILGGGLGMNLPSLQAAFSASLSAENIGPVHILDRPPVYGAPHLAGF